MRSLSSLVLLLSAVLWGSMTHAQDASSSPTPTVSSAPPSSASPDPEGVSPTDDQAARSVLGNDDGDVPDPVADEGARSGSAEGDPVPARAVVADEIAALSDRQCIRALEHAHVPFERLHALGGVATPVRITGAILGVRYRASDRSDIHELMDCRLAVALVRFSRMLRHLGVHEVTHYSTFRPAGSRAIAEHPLQSRHGGGLAIDAAWFFRDDGQRFNVDRDFHSRLGRLTCGPDARVPHHEGARFLRTIVCDAARLGIFNVILTPHFNRAHHNHFHLEVARGVNWRAVH